jgi:propionyl-CoA carboxylase alpha chain
VIRKLLIANRGEIARRIAATCHSLGVQVVAVHSDADSDSLYVREANERVRLAGTAPADTYLRADLLIDAAIRSGADAIHPGYGFLAENAAFARAVIDAGLVWVGPPPGAMAAMGSKVESKRLMREAGVPVLPEGPEAGFPALVKASAGGGGRGMRIVRAADELQAAVAAAEREAEAAFGDGTVFVERYVERGRHIEIQVFADTHGNCVPLFERECSIQRRHQKIVEECPSPAVHEALRAQMSAAAVAAARAVDYVGAGTVEFLLAPDGAFYFLEMNTRLQVEHPVTELVTGLDLVALQIAVAEGAPLPETALHPTLHGHAIEVRLCAEDPAAGYLPQTGTLHRVEFATAPHVRVDTGVADGSVVPPYYDSMLAKAIAWAPTRDGAARRLAGAMRTARLHGVVTNRDQLVRVLEHPEFLAGNIDTGFLERFPCIEPLVHDPVPAAVAAALALQAERRGRAATLAHVPSGWRNVPAHDQTVSFTTADGRTVGVGYRMDRSGQVVSVTVDAQPSGITVSSASADSVVLEVDGVSSVYRVGVSGSRVDVDGPTGPCTLHVVDRFPLPDAAGAAGSLAAPMPGAVLRVLVAVGDAVVAGQPLVVLEAMKMEHQVLAPDDGTVTGVLVDAGDQVATGQTLLTVDGTS